LVLSGARRRRPLDFCTLTFLVRCDLPPPAAALRALDAARRQRRPVLNKLREVVS
jgi:hypothetical protein